MLFNFSQAAIMSSLTLTLNGDTSELSANYFPPIKLDDDGEYVCGLVDFQSFMSIPNITDENNRLYYLRSTQFKVKPGRYTFAEFLEWTKRSIPFEFRDDPDMAYYLEESLDASKSNVEKEDNSVIQYYQVNEQYIQSVFHVAYFEVPTGTYEFSDIDHFVTRVLNSYNNGSYMHIAINKNTLKSEIISNVFVFFNKPNTFGELLGFAPTRVLRPDISHESDTVVKISPVNTIKLECNITSGAYSNDKLCHTIHEFYPTVEPGFKIVEAPQNVIYLPLTVRTINNLTVKCVDQDNRPVNFRGETITLRVHIKKINK